MTDIYSIKMSIAKELGISEVEIPNSILYKIYSDDLFLHHLSICKDERDFLNILLKEQTLEIENESLPSNSELIIKLSKSIKNWIGTGLKRTNSEEYGRRISICNVCPNRVEPDNRFLYKMISSNYICKLCGCDIERKAAIQSEECPDKVNNSYGRW